MRAFTKFTSLLAIVSIASLSGVDSAKGSTIVVSNLTADGEQSLPVRRSDGAPLPLGALGMLGAFPALTDGEIGARFESGDLDALLASFVRVGEAFVVGQGSGEAGQFEVVAHESLAPSGARSAVVGETPYLVIADAAAIEVATQWLILSIASAVFPEDPEVGLESFFALHLTGAETVVGGSDGEGFLAAPIPPPEPITYGAWSAAMFEIGTPASDLLPEADPDGDGLTNLAEFATGSHPSLSDRTDPAKLALAVDGETMDLTFLHRSNGVALELSVEVSDTLRGPWVGAGVEAVVVSGQALSADIQWFSARVPVAGRADSFVRLHYRLVE